MFKRVIQYIISLYAYFVFAVLFVVVSPLFFIVILVKRWHHHGLKINPWWSRAFFALCFIRVRIENRGGIDKKGVYVYCPNHFSYMDIPVMGYAPTIFQFVGKISLSKIPLFGYMFKKLHITVDRESMRSRYETIEKSKQAIERGLSLTIFPEGGIRTPNPPQVSRFKDGAFRVAIEKQVPIVPVTIPYNWIILPKNAMILDHRLVKVIFHEPIDTKGLTLEDVETLREKTFSIIDKELKVQNYESR